MHNKVTSKKAKQFTTKKALFHFDNYSPRVDNRETIAWLDR